MVRAKQGDKPDDDPKAEPGDGAVLVLTFPVPREPESEPPEPDQDEIPTIIPKGLDLPQALQAGVDDRATEPPEEMPTEPPPCALSAQAREAPTQPPCEPATLVPPKAESTEKRTSRPPA